MRRFWDWFTDTIGVSRGVYLALWAAFVTNLLFDLIGHFR